MIQVSSGAFFAVDQLLRTELREQGTLLCCGRTDKLCVGGMLGVGTKMPR